MPERYFDRSFQAFHKVSPARGWPFCMSAVVHRCYSTLLPSSVKGEIHAEVAWYMEKYVHVMMPHGSRSAIRE